MPDASDITVKSFDKEVLEADEPVVVEFFNHSCPHSYSIVKERIFLDLWQLGNDRNHREMQHPPFT